MRRLDANEFLLPLRSAFWHNAKAIEWFKIDLVHVCQHKSYLNTPREAGLNIKNVRNIE